MEEVQITGHYRKGGTTCYAWNNKKYFLEKKSLIGFPLRPCTLYLFFPLYLFPFSGFLYALHPTPFYLFSFLW